MNSFYGGKQGLTYNIVQRFPSVKKMVEAFNNGGAYSKVNYGQYVLIDTISTRQNYVDQENGLLFRRGFDYQKGYVDPTTVENWEGWTATTWEQWLNDGVGGGAIYVGQISGPMGKSPTIKLQAYNNKKSYETVENVQNIFKPATADLISNQFKIGYLNSVIGLPQTPGTPVQRIAEVGLQIPYPTINLSATTVSTNFPLPSHNNSTYLPSIDVDNGINLIHIDSNNNGLYQDAQIAIPIGGFQIVNKIESQNKTIFTINSTIPDYSRVEEKEDGTIVIPPINSQTLSLEAESVDELKLKGDKLYYHTHLNQNKNANTIGITEQNPDGTIKYWNYLGIPNGQFHVYTYFSANDKETALDKLNQTLPFGIDDGKVRPTQYTIGPHAGWIVGIKFKEYNEETHLDEEKIELYAFDYTTSINSIQEDDPNTSAWFKIADFSTSLISPDTVIIVDYPQEDNPNIPANYNYSLNPVLDGIWLLKQNLPADAEDWSEV